MNSFISNFKTEAKVVATVLIALLVCELALRKLETSLSLDLKHIRSFPRIAAELAKAEGTRILFLGNSLTRSGTNPKVFTEELERRGFGEVSVQRAHPDGSHIEEWFYTFKTYFAEPKLLPDLLVIFTGRAHLQDQASDPSTIGAYYSSTKDLPRFLFSEKRTIDTKMEFLLGRYSTAYANRRRIEPRLFSLIIPHYQSCVQRINEGRARSAGKTRKVNAPTYSRLEQLLELAQKNSVPIVFATVPMFEPYGLDPKIKQLIEAHGMKLIKADKIAGIDSSHFPDAYHLDEIGAEKYSRVLAEKLAEVFPGNSKFQRRTTTNGLE